MQTKDSYRKKVSNCTRTLEGTILDNCKKLQYVPILFSILILYLPPNLSFETKMTQKFWLNQRQLGHLKKVARYLSKDSEQMLLPKAENTF